MSKASRVTLSPMVLAIAEHREAHERYRLATHYRNVLPGGAPDMDTADEAASNAGDALDKALSDLGCVIPQSSDDVGALALHLRMILATAEHFEGEHAPFKECFGVLESACVVLSGRPAA